MLVQPATVDRWHRDGFRRCWRRRLRRPGRPSIDSQCQELIQRLEETPRGATHWSLRGMAKASGVSRSTVNRIWREQDLAVAARVLVDGRLLQVARSTDSRAVLLQPLRRTFLWIGGAVVVIGFGTGVVAARRATRPLRDVIATAQRIISTGELDARVPLPKRDDDVAELVRAFNTVLDKNAGLLRTMREALDNVAHDLRTPLTRLRGTAELALQSVGGNGVQHEALADCVEQADDVLKLLRALMEISEAEAGMLRLEKTPCDLGAIARSAAGTLYGSG